jgi:hypothetical protein
MKLKEFIATLDGAGLEAEPENVLDAFWLASRRRTLTLYPPSDQPDPASPPPPPPAPLPPPLPSPGPPPPPALPLTVGREIPTALVYALGNVSSGDRTVKATPVALPAGRALGDRLALMRAMRPLREPWLSRRVSELDEERTAQASADLRAVWPQMIYPVLRPTESRWFDVDVVQEDDPAIELWNELLRDFTQLLRNTGAFRTVRSWRLRLPSGPTGTAAASAGATIETPAGAVFSSLTLAGRGIRRLIFFASHGSSEHWVDGGYARLLEPWIRNCSTVMLHLMPRERWPHTPLGEPHGICAAERPGPTAATLRVEPFWWRLPFDPEDPALLPLPAVPLDASAVLAWAHMQMGRGRRASVFLPDPSLPPGEKRHATPPSKRDFERIIANLRDVSPSAFRLAVYLASSPFTLPVARLVQEVKFGPAAEPSQLAELFLSGLLGR